MAFREIVKTSPRLPAGITLPDCAWLKLEQIFHLPGQTAALRFFKPHSLTDYRSLKSMLLLRRVRQWMDDTRVLSKTAYVDWAGTDTLSSFLFAVLDAREETKAALKNIRGFVYLYSERSEKFRLKRLLKAGLIKPEFDQVHALEISFASRAIRRAPTLGSGLMASAVRQACLQVRTQLKKEVKGDLPILGFIDPANLAAQRTLISAGFSKIGQMKYDPDSPGISTVYQLKWRKLREKIHQKLVELQANP